MIYFHWLVLFVYLVVVIGTMITILMDNRQPAKTMAWLLVLTFLPVVGIVLYFFFGQNVRKERYISQRSLDQLTKRSMIEFAEQKDMCYPDKYKTLMSLFANEGLALPFKDNQVEILENGYRFFGALLQQIGRAQHHIHLETYIIEDDALGNLIADALCDKAKEGVEVRLIYDDVGCWKVKKAFFERLRDGGVDVHAFMPVKFPAFTSKVNYRNHRKICVIDGQTAFIGGMNIAMRYLKGTKTQAWRDTHLLVRGGVVYALQRTFLVDWYFVDRTLVSGSAYYPKIDSSLSNNCIAQVVGSSPIEDQPDIMHGYTRILLEAKHYVYMETPYFLPTEPVLFAIQNAALSGVDVRLIVPRHGDAKLTEWASRSYLSQVIEAGAKVWFYEAGFNHSKLLVSDDMLSTCGSTNIDFRSFENNFEANIFFYDEQQALRMKALFESDLQQSTLVDEWQVSRQYRFLQRLLDSLVRLLSPLL